MPEGVGDLGPRRIGEIDRRPDWGWQRGAHSGERCGYAMHFGWWSWRDPYRRLVRVT